MRHENVWPEMRAALTKAGWGNYSIFLAGDGLLVGYLETEHDPFCPYPKGFTWSDPSKGIMLAADYQAALDEMAATDVNRRWQEEMSEFFVAAGPPDQSFLRLAEIFHLD